MRASRRQRGQALTETALTLVILLLIFSGIVDVGRAFMTYLALHNAAGEGAYYGSAFPLRLNNTLSADPDNITFRALNEVPSNLQQYVDWSEATVAVSYSSTVSPPTVGSTITVEVSTPFVLVGPLPNLLGWDDAITLRARATQTILTNTDSN